MSNLNASSPLRLNPTLPRPAPDATGQGELTEARQHCLKALQQVARDAQTVTKPSFFDFERISHGLKLASDFGPSCPESRAGVIGLLDGFVQLVHKLFDEGEASLVLQSIAGFPLMTESPMLEEAVDFLLQKQDPVAIHLAVSLVAQLSRSNPSAPNLPRLTETVLRAYERSPSPSGLAHCIDSFSELAKDGEHAPMAAFLAGLCFDRIEAALISAQPSLHENVLLLCDFIEEHPFAHTEAIHKRLGRLIANISGAVATLAQTSDKMPERVATDTFQAARLLFQSGLPFLLAHKTEAALAMFTRVPVSQFASLRPFARLLWIDAFRYLPEASQVAWVTALLSTQSSGAVPLTAFDLDSLSSAVNAMAEGHHRESLSGAIRATLVTRFMEASHWHKLPFIRRALRIGAGGEDQLAAELVKTIQDPGFVHFQNLLSDDEREHLQDEFAIVSFILDPDSTAPDPDSQASNAGNATNPQRLLCGQPFVCPGWLSARRAVLQAAHPPGGSKKTEIAEHLPEVLAELTDRYAAGRLVGVDDCNVLRGTLVTARAAGGMVLAD